MQIGVRPQVMLQDIDTIRSLAHTVARSPSPRGSALAGMFSDRRLGLKFAEELLQNLTVRAEA